MTEPKWTFDKYGILNLIARDEDGHRVHLWISVRPLYCDRGHYLLQIDAPSFYLDHSDCFPRYYMTQEAAIEEAEAFLRWRIHKQPGDNPVNRTLRPVDGRPAIGLSE